MPSVPRQLFLPVLFFFLFQTMDKSTANFNASVIPSTSWLLSKPKFDLFESILSHYSPSIPHDHAYHSGQQAPQLTLAQQHQKEAEQQQIIQQLQEALHQQAMQRQHESLQQKPGQGPILQQHGAVQANHGVTQQQHVIAQQHAVAQQQHAVADQQHAVAEQQHAVAQQQHAIAQQQHAVAQQQQTLHHQPAQKQPPTLQQQVIAQNPQIAQQPAVSHLHEAVQMETLQQHAYAQHQAAAQLETLQQIADKQHQQAAQQQEMEQHAAAQHQNAAQQQALEQHAVAQHQNAAQQQALEQHAVAQHQNAEKQPAMQQRSAGQQWPAPQQQQRSEPAQEQQQALQKYAMQWLHEKNADAATTNLLQSDHSSSSSSSVGIPPDSVSKLRTSLKEALCTVKRKLITELTELGHIAADSAGKLTLATKELLQELNNETVSVVSVVAYLPELILLDGPQQFLETLKILRNDSKNKDITALDTVIAFLEGNTETKSKIRTKLQPAFDSLPNVVKSLGDFFRKIIDALFEFIE